MPSDLTGLVRVRRIRFDSEVVGSAWSPDRRFLAVATRSGRVEVRWAYQLARLQTATVVSVEPTAGTVLRWSDDGPRLLIGKSAGSGGTIIGTRGPEIRGPEVVRLSERGRSTRVWDYAWSPDSTQIAGSASVDGKSVGIHLWDAATGQVRESLGLTDLDAHLLRYGPDGLVAAGRAPTWEDSTGPALSQIRWDRRGPSIVERLTQPHGKHRVTGLAALSPTSVVSVGDDGSAAVWDLRSGRLLRRIEAVTNGLDRSPLSVQISSDGALMIIQGVQVAVVWSTANWQPLGTLPLHGGRAGPRTVAGFRPGTGEYATAEGNEVVIWNLSGVQRAVPEAAAGAGSGAQVAPAREEYRNAKVVLVGDSGVGKSGLALVLTGQPYRPTTSTHGRHVWTLERRRVEAETREILLWDLAGQPGYRLFHRLSLRDVAVGLVLFDAHSESDPFAGVAYWAAALDEAAQGAPLVKLLVAARVDRGGPSVSRERIDEVLQRYGFAGVLETSAELGRGVRELGQEIRRRIDWAALPAISASVLFAEIQQFVTREKERGRLFADEESLLRDFRRSRPEAVDPVLFRSCLRRQEAAGLIGLVAFEGQWLLQPEMLDNYAAWLAHAARDEPDGLGFLAERRAVDGDFPHDRLSGPDERMMLLAAVEEVVGRGLVLRVPTDRGEMLVFPSEVRADLPDYPGDYVQVVAFSFTGPVSTIYSTVVVRLANSITFTRDQLYRRAALFRGPRDQLCGLAATYEQVGDDSRGRLMVFFDPGTERDVELLFLRYVNEQLAQLALSGSIVRERIYRCRHGHPPVPPDFVAVRRAEGHSTVICAGCGEHLALDELAEESAERDDRIASLDRSALDQQRRQQRLTVLPARIAERRYHAFLCHNSRDKPQVRQLARRLADEGILAWLDEEGTLGGDQVVPTLESLMMQVPAAVIVVGPHDLGRWQSQEYYVLLQRFVETRGDSSLRIIPVLLPGVPAEPELPPFLRTFEWIDLRGGLADRAAMRAFLDALQQAGGW